MINVVLRLLVSLRSMAGSSYRKKRLYCTFRRISLYLFLLVVLIKLTESFDDMKHRRTLDFGLEAFLF